MNNEEIPIENKLKDLRKQHKLSQEELAEELGISRQSVIALEQGKYMPSLPLVINMCKFFHSPFEEIFEFQREIEEEMDKIFNGNNKKNIINIKFTDRPIHLPQNIELDHSGLVGDKENIVANEMEPWRPFREVVSLRDAMDRLFEDSVITPKGTAAMPKIDIKDQKESIVVRAEMPGMTEDQIDVEISDGIMTISGEKAEEKEKESDGYYYKESHTGAFSRSFTLPAEVVAEKAEAEMKDGVLSISIPKIEPKKATKVKVAPKKK